MSKEYILVTGSAGFIGFSLVKELLSRGYNVVGVDNFNDYYLPLLKERRNSLLEKSPNFVCRRASLDNYEQMEKVFKEFNIFLVCNLAAQAGVRRSMEEPFVCEKSNIAGFLNILELVRNYHIPKLVFASSASVYGGNKKIPFSEADNVDTPISLYAATKKSNELMAHGYTHLFNFQSICLRFFSAYGPWGRPDMALWLFTEAILSGKPIDVYNYGNMRRDFTFIDDIVSGIIAALFSKNLDKYEVFNLGNHKSEQLLDMIGIIETELGITAIKNMMPMQPGDIPESFADIEKARIKLNYIPSTTIAKGIPEFISWYKSHPEIASAVAKSRC